MYQIDNQSRRAVYEQIMEQVEKYILTGVLVPDEQMPSVRAMSINLHLNPNTVQRAYVELERRGLIYSATGRGSFVNSDAMEILRKEKRQNMGGLLRTLHEFALSGVSKEEIVTLVEQVYSEKLQND